MLGKSEKSGIAKLNSSVPGPGTYSNQGGLSGPKWGFGSGKRTSLNDSGVPGPGTYEIKSTVGAAPSYNSISH